MSIESLIDMTAGLPPSLRDQVLGYAQSVRVAAPNIARDLGVHYSSRFEEHLVFVSGLRKLFSIVSSSFWSLDNSSTLLERSGTTAISIAGKSYSKGSEVHTKLFATVVDLELVLEQLGMLSIMKMSFEEMVEVIADELK